MARTLDVYLHTDLVGRLTQDEDGDMSFQYAESWLQGAGAVPLSHSLPLRAERFRRRECRGFFAGILPEETKREMVARNLGISARNDYAMLERIGGECAGAVTFLPHGGPMPDRQYGYRDLSEEELAAILKELPRRPLLAGEEGIRLSLAGAQDKLAVRLEGRTISLPSTALRAHTSSSRMWSGSKAWCSTKPFACGWPPPPACRRPPSRHARPAASVIC